MYTLGINAVFHDSAACLLKNGQLIAAAEEERFTHIKHGKRPVPFSTWELPFHAIDYCLRTAGIHINDIDHVAYSFDPYLLIGEQYRGKPTIEIPFDFIGQDAQSDWLNPWDPLFLSFMLNARQQLNDGYPHHLQKRFIGANIRSEQWHYVEHHVAHAASAFNCSPHLNAAVMTVDGRGELATTTYNIGNGQQLHRIGQVNMPHSLGLLYEDVTTYLGFLHSSDEYKVMALASYGKKDFVKDFREIIQLGANGQYTVTNQHLTDRFGPQRLRHEQFRAHHFNIAHSLQSVLEESLLELTGWLQRETDAENLCMAGGVALNCVANARIRDAGVFKNIWVQPASGDDGTALGAALWIDAQQRKSTKPHSETLNYLPGNLVCFSHLRWDFVFQRPQHLLTRLAKSMNVFYLEEPVIGAVDRPQYSYHSRGSQLTVITPQLPAGLSTEASLKIQKELFENFMSHRAFHDYGFWYYTPMALEFSSGFSPDVTVFDCMDELSSFKFAPESLKTLEKELFKVADIVFTGGHSLYEAKKHQHKNVHAFPSSIDKSHFAKARGLKDEYASTIKLGFYGVIDERFDIGLVSGIANLRPEWEIILIGPVVKIDPSTLPVNPNIKYLGAKTYQELPEFMADWDIALIPFLLNDSTRFISPTKTPEYLAAGLPVISTAIRDVVHPYGKFGLVAIGGNAEEFVAHAELEIDRADRKEWLQKIDFFLAHNSWDETCSRMVELIGKTIKSSRVVYNTIAQS